MTSIPIGAQLRQWRKTSNISQVILAQELNVTQAAISRWENGVDEPSPLHLALIRQKIACHQTEEAIERRFISRQISPRALFEADGMTLIASSRGLQELWPTFSAMIGTSMADNMIGESAPFVHDADLSRMVRRGDLTMVTGVSHRHLDVMFDEPFLHRWHACTRRIGSRTLIELVFEVCEPDAHPGIEDMILPELIA